MAFPAPPFSPTPPQQAYKSLLSGVEHTNSKRAHTFKTKATSHTLHGRLMQTLGIEGGKAAESSSEFPNAKKQEK